MTDDVTALVERLRRLGGSTARKAAATLEALAQRIAELEDNWWKSSRAQAVIHEFAVDHKEAKERIAELEKTLDTWRKYPNYQALEIDARRRAERAEAKLAQAEAREALEHLRSEAWRSLARRHCEEAGHDEDRLDCHSSIKALAATPERIAAAAEILKIAPAITVQGRATDVWTNAVRRYTEAGS